MPLFEVTLSDRSTRILQARKKTDIPGVLHDGVIITSITQKRRCKRCRKAGVIATVQNTLCHPCWDEVLTHCREVWKDVAMTEQDLEDTAMSYFVDA